MSKRRPAAQTAPTSTAQRPAVDQACARLAADFAALFRALAPSEEAIEHFSNARVEMLKGLRAIIDARIDRISTERQKGTPVEIE
jgi:hypothetical protein